MARGGTGRADAVKGDRGSASVITIGIGLAVLLLAIGVAAIAAAMIARHQAQAAADFAALAAAPHALAGQEFACASALHIAEANGGRLMRCAVDGLDAVTTVSMSVDIPLPGLGSRTAEASSRAGPAAPEETTPPEPAPIPETATET
ncbi:Rv3654c family TadE-like protein [Actinorhabdospora filicis]|nr:Rv3654c family TadE-like protein [Actinorhabdospora filicis]